MNNVIDFINTNRDRYIDELEGLPRDSQHQRAARACGDVRRVRRMDKGRNGAHRAAERPADRHARPSGRLRRLAGRRRARPTILFYGHYDVQPVDPLELWESPPFEATVRDGEIYARGAADDKGQVFMHFKAIEAHLQAERQAAGQHEDHPRGRGGSRLRAPRRLHPRSQVRPRRRRRGHLRLADVRPRHSLDLLRPARARLLPDRSQRERRAICIPVRSAAPSPTRRW